MTEVAYTIAMFLLAFLSWILLGSRRSFPLHILAIILTGSFFLTGTCFLAAAIFGISPWALMAVYIVLFGMAIFNPRIIR
jgi:hypothetical protein